MYGLLNVSENLFGRFFDWFPFYNCLKMLFLVWLFYPKSRGTQIVYQKFILPFMKHYQIIQTSKSTTVESLPTSSEISSVESSQPICLSPSSPSIPASVSSSVVSTPFTPSHSLLDSSSHTVHSVNPFVSSPLIVGDLSNSFSSESVVADVYTYTPALSSIP